MLAVVRAAPEQSGAGTPEPSPLAPVEMEAEWLLARLATHDPATEVHCRRVATWSGKIATALGQSPERSAFVGRGGRLHDIGKLFTPVSILRKAGPLTARQVTRMQDHVTDGAEMLTAAPLLRPYVDIVIAHHERFDGSGYPQGLVGEAIPHDARIVAVADALDAMISGRPYREAIRPVQALDELERSSDSHFDPVVVHALITLIKPPRPKRQEKER